MNCYKPIMLPNPAYANINYHLLVGAGFGYTNDYLSSLQDVTTPYIYAPCRRCPACLKRRATEWSGRLSREVEYYHSLGKRCSFLTLTYDESYIEHAEDNYKHDVAVFFDRLRSKLRRNIRHFVIAERGEKKGRFHLHAILFDTDDAFAPDSHFHRSKNGELHGSNSMLAERWSKGIVDVGFVKSCGVGIYVAGYLTKNRPRCNGEFYVSPIIASNGIGFRDVTALEIYRIKGAIRDGILPTYSVGSRKYNYPDFFLRRYLSIFDRMHISRINGENASVLGGHFVFGVQRFNNYCDYCSLVDSYLSSITTFHISRYKNVAFQIVESRVDSFAIGSSSDVNGVPLNPWEEAKVSYYDYCPF